MDDERNILVRTPSNLMKLSIQLQMLITAHFYFNVLSQNVPQAYLAFAKTLVRDIHAELSKEFKLWKKVLIKLLKLIYGLKDYGDYWRPMFARCLRKDLLMIYLCLDPALL